MRKISPAATSQAMNHTATTTAPIMPANAPSRATPVHGPSRCCAQRRMSFEKKRQHRRSRHQIADQELPPRQRHVGGRTDQHQDHDAEDLEHRDQHHHGRKERLVVLGGLENQRGDDSDKRKDAKMEDQPAEHKCRASLRSAEQRRGQRSNGAERLTPGSVEDQVPQRDHERADYAGHGAINEHAYSLVHRILLSTGAPRDKSTYTMGKRYRSERTGGGLRTMMQLLGEARSAPLNPTNMPCACGREAA